MLSFVELQLGIQPLSLSSQCPQNPSLFVPVYGRAPGAQRANACMCERILKNYIYTKLCALTPKINNPKFHGLQTTASRVSWRAFDSRCWQHAPSSLASKRLLAETHFRKPSTNPTLQTQRAAVLLLLDAGLAWHIAIIIRGRSLGSGAG